MALGAARRWFLEHRGIRLPPDAFVDVLLRGVDDPQFRAHLLRRLRRGKTVRVALLAAAAVVGALGLAAGAVALTMPAELVLASDVRQLRHLRSGSTFEVEPRLELRNRMAKRVRSRDGDTVRAESGMPGVPLLGRKIGRAHV